VLLSIVYAIFRVVLEALVSGKLLGWRTGPSCASATTPTDDRGRW
jgi:hypothetical protein